MTEFLQGYMPLLASKMGHLGDNLNGIVHWLMLILFIGWGIYLIIAVIKFSSKSQTTLGILKFLKSFSLSILHMALITVFLYFFDVYFIFKISL